MESKDEKCQFEKIAKYDDEIKKVQKELADILNNKNTDVKLDFDFNKFSENLQSIKKVFENMPKD